MSYRNYIFRRVINARNRKRLKNHTFTLFSNNCNGGCICHDLGLEFRSPFINLFITAPDYMKILRAPHDYLGKPLDFLAQHPESYPVAMLGDAKIHFMHYHSDEEAKSAWQRRLKRIDWDNLLVLMSDQDGCTEEIIREFDALPYKHKALFTHIPHPEIASAVYIPGFEERDSVGNCDAFISKGSGRKYFDAFDYVAWFNSAKEDCGG